MKSSGDLPLHMLFSPQTTELGFNFSGSDTLVWSPYKLFTKYLCRIVCDGFKRKAAKGRWQEECELRLG